MTTSTSRRRFLVGAGATGVASVLAPVASAQAKPDTAKAAPAPAPQSCTPAVQTRGLNVKPTPTDLPLPEVSKTGIFNPGQSLLNEGEAISASRWGVFYTQVKGGRIAHLRPFEYDLDPSVNLNAYANLPYNPARIRHPYVRKGFLERGPASRNERGNDEYVRVSWDEALDLAAKHIDRIYDEYGPSAVWGTSYGWQSTGKVNGGMYMVERLLECRGGYVHSDNNYSYAASGRILPYVVGSGDPRSTAWPLVIEHSERVIFWGCDPLVSNEVDWFTTIHTAAGYFRSLKAKGIKTYAVNPLRPDIAEYMDSEWIAPRPGTDVAMMLGMVETLLTAKKVDMAFLEKYTSGYRQFLDYVEGKTDGVRKTAEWAEKITGVPAKKIRELAFDVQSHRTMLMIGWGLQRTQFGEQPHWMAYALMACTGQIGLPGGGVGANYHYSGGGSPTGMGPFVTNVGSGVKKAKACKEEWKGSKSVPVARWVDCLLNPGKEIEFDGQTITYPEIQLVMWAGGNPFSHQPQSFQVEEAWKRPEVTICTDINWTATARHADIVFPACTTFEHEDITNIGTYANEGIVAMKQAIEPQFESRPDYWIHSEIAKRMGIGEAFTEGRTERQWIEHLYNQAAKIAKLMKKPLPTFEEFWEKGYVMFPVDEASKRYIQLGDFREDPEGNPLSTETGKIVLFSEKIASFGYKDCLGHPSYLEPTENLNNHELRKTFPLAAVVGKSRYRLHSQLDSTSGQALNSVDGREPLWMNPEDAKARGIESGDMLLVKNNRGAAMAVAMITDRIMPGVVCLHHGAWFAPAKTEAGRICVRGCSNAITQDIPTSRLAQGNVASTLLVEVQKWKGDLPDMYIWRQPASVTRQG